MVGAIAKPEPTFFKGLFKGKGGGGYDDHHHGGGYATGHEVIDNYGQYPAPQPT